MIKKIVNRIKLNFRQSKSDRSATGSYREYGHYFKQKIKYITNKVKS